MIGGGYDGAVEAHQMVGYDVRKADSAVAAKCSCGWRSDWTPAAGVAYSMWDHHKAGFLSTDKPADSTPGADA